MPSRHILTLLFLVFLGPFAVSSAPCNGPEQPATGDADPLNAYPRSDAFADNVAWHKKVGENEIRMSWFLHGDPKVAMVCTADLSKYKVTTSREVYDWASQNYKTSELSDEQVRVLRKLAKSLPASAKAPALENLVLVSVSEEEKAKTYLYNRMDLPRDIVRLYDLTGAYVDTEPLPSQEKKKKKKVNPDLDTDVLQMLQGIVVRIGALPGEMINEKKTDAEIIDGLFLATLLRLPTDTEKKHCLKTLGSLPNREEGSLDVAWVLINTQEFIKLHGLDDKPIDETIRALNKLIQKSWKDKAKAPKDN
jgi:hypothetical protein